MANDNLRELARTLAALTDDEYNTVTTQARGTLPTPADEFAQFLTNQTKPADHLAGLLDTRKEGNTDDE